MRERSRSCPRCKAPIRGYVDECPSCGFEKPVALPWHVYGLMALIFVAAMWFLIDLDAIARAILAVREGLRSM
ncbi:MAG: hypothetical protein JSU82_11525 [Rhodospirillales bacterium]|nr:MAG: hypothetical protein JSU82_11525 [Rhodospirillales bacterium]